MLTKGMPSKQHYTQLDKFNPAGIVIACDGLDSLKRSPLTSLINAMDPRLVKVPIAVSINYYGTQSDECVYVVHAFNWPNGAL
jgi:hypothetical protein